MSRRGTAHARESQAAQGPCDALVLFGATGDLAYKKLFPALQSMIRHGRLDVPVVGIAKSGWDLPRFARRVRKSLAEHGGGDNAAAEKLVSALGYVDGDYRDRDTFVRLRTALNGAKRPLHYLAIPPSLFPVVVERLEASGCARGARLVVEKPFGRDLASARSLNRTLHDVFEESAIFRIDHYLGKESVRNVLYFRFANTFLEPIWNRNYVACVEVSMAERFGVEGRGAFYDEVGAIRDVVQNHLLQVVANLAMEPPIGTSAEAIRDEKVKVFRSIRPCSGRSLVRGQYRGYRSEPGVATDSAVETYAAMELRLDSWRWDGVPFFIRAGKCLPVTATEVMVTLKPPPRVVFADRIPGRFNYLRFRLGPDRVAIALGAHTKSRGEKMSGEAVELLVRNERDDEAHTYERLIGDAMKGDASLFARQDSVEAAWAIVEPLLELHGPVHGYSPGSWGPSEAESMLAAYGGWHDPRANMADERTSTFSSVASHREPSLETTP